MSRATVNLTDQKDIEAASNIASKTAKDYLSFNALNKITFVFG